MRWFVFQSFCSYQGRRCITEVETEVSVSIYKSECPWNWNDLRTYEPCMQGYCWLSRHCTITEVGLRIQFVHESILTYICMYVSSMQDTSLWKTLHYNLVLSMQVYDLNLSKLCKPAVLSKISSNLNLAYMGRCSDVSTVVMYRGIMWGSRAAGAPTYRALKSV